MTPCVQPPIRDTWLSRKCDSTANDRHFTASEKPFTRRGTPIDERFTSSADDGAGRLEHEGMPLSPILPHPTHAQAGSRLRVAIRTIGLVAVIGLVVTFATRSRESLGAEQAGGVSATRGAPQPRPLAPHGTSPDTLPRTWLEMKNV